MDAEVTSVLRIPLQKLPHLPDLVGRLCMPTGIPIVMPPVLEFFAAEVARYSSSAVDERFHAALEAEVKRGVINALGAEYYWTGRVLRLGAPLVGQLRNWERDGVPVLRVIDRYGADPFPPRDLLRRAELAQEAPDNKLFTRRDYVTGEPLIPKANCQSLSLVLATTGVVLFRRQRVPGAALPRVKAARWNCPSTIAWS